MHYNPTPEERRARYRRMREHRPWSSVHRAAALLVVGYAVLAAVLMVVS